MGESGKSKFDIRETKEIREETDFTEVNNLLSNGWLLLKIITKENSFLYILVRT